MKYILPFLILLAIGSTSCVLDVADYPYHGTSDEVAMLNKDSGKDLETDSVSDLKELVCQGPQCTCFGDGVCACQAQTKCENIACNQDNCDVRCEDADKCKVNCEDAQMCVLRCGTNQPKDCAFKACKNKRECKDGVSVCNRACPSGLELGD